VSPEPWSADKAAGVDLEKAARHPELSPSAKELMAVAALQHRFSVQKK
jgi:hypothetical protein